MAGAVDDDLDDLDAVLDDVLVAGAVVAGAVVAGAVVAGAVDADAVVAGAVVAGAVDAVKKLNTNYSKKTVSNGVEDIHKLPLDWFNSTRQNYKINQIIPRKKEIIIDNSSSKNCKM